MRSTVIALFIEIRIGFGRFGSYDVSKPMKCFNAAGIYLKIDRSSGTWYKCQVTPAFRKRSFPPKVSHLVFLNSFLSLCFADTMQWKLLFVSPVSSI